MGDACEFDTNGDGNCGRYTCARCYPQHQPLKKPATAPTVRPAVAGWAWQTHRGGIALCDVPSNTPSDRPITGVDGTPADVLARVQAALFPLKSRCSPLDYKTAVEEVRRALGLPTEATTDGK